MPALRFRLAACALVLYALTQTAAPAHAGQGEGDADGLIRTGLVLNGRSISVEYDPALPSDHRSLLVLRAGSTQAAVRLGRIEGHRSLAMGTLAPDPDAPRAPAPDHDLWLMRTGAGWVLDARPVEEPADADDGESGGDPSDAAGDDADEIGGAESAETTTEPADAGAEAEDTEAEDAEAENAEAESEDTETDAEGAETDAEGAETDAEGAETDAEGAETDAEGAETDAEGAETDAEGAETDAEGAETDAEDADADADSAETDAESAEADEDAEGGDAGAERDEADGEADEASPENVEAAPEPQPGRIPLTHRPLADEAQTLAVRLLPAADEAGTLELVWGRNQWTADFEFVELPRPPRPPRTSNVSPGTSLTRDSNLDARYRAAALGSRNETALRTLDGARVQVLFEQELGTDGVDFAALESIGDGDLVELTEGAVIRLRSEVPLRFGDTLIPTDNLAPDFPGSYGLWLRASGPGWTLVFNNEPDSWGTQHDPAFDAAEVDIDHTHGGPYEDRPLGVSLVPSGGDAGRLVIVWGQHVWAADFTVEP